MIELFHTAQEELEKMGAHITTAEIAQQPELWQETLAIYDEHKASVAAFLKEFQEELADASIVRPIRVVFTGAGTSDYVGGTIAPYLSRMGEKDVYTFSPIPSTDIVSAPLNYLNPDEPCVLVSFARSGNSPESLAAVELASKLIHHVRFLHITCAPEGALAQEGAKDKRAYTLLIPRANDKGFAMTGSFSCMALLATLIFDTTPEENKALFVETAASMGQAVLASESQIAQWLGDDYTRVTFLGSGCFARLAQEAQLKILELAHGLIATSWDSSMGYRHGPKSFVDDKTLVFIFVSNDVYTRRYDLDILHEIAGDNIALRTIAIQQDAASEKNFEGDAFTFEGFTALPDVYLVLPYIMIAQAIALKNSIKVKNTPDTPSPTGTVNRVVKGVTIHPFDDTSGA